MPTPEPPPDFNQLRRDQERLYLEAKTGILSSILQQTDAAVIQALAEAYKALGHTP